MVAREGVTGDVTGVVSAGMAQWTTVVSAGMAQWTTV